MDENATPSDGDRQDSPLDPEARKPPEQAAIPPEGGRRGPSFESEASQHSAESRAPSDGDLEDPSLDPEEGPLEDNATPSESDSEDPSLASRKSNRKPTSTSLSQRVVIAIRLIRQATRVGTAGVAAECRSLRFFSSLSALCSSCIRPMCCRGRFGWRCGGSGLSC